MENKVSLLMPSVLKDFKCIGPDCSDHCCKKWGINIDKWTFDKYKYLNAYDNNFLVEKNIKVINKENEYNYGIIILKDDRNCPFLEKNSLCYIHRKYGEGYLSDTCFSYPRSYRVFDDIVEVSPCLSCPEAAKLILFKSNKMTFDYNKEVVFKRRVLATQQIKTNCEADSLENNLWDIREFSIDLIQNDKYTLNEKLIILGLFCDEISKNNYEKQKVIDKYKKIIEDLDEVKNLVKRINVDLQTQIQYLFTTIKLRKKLPYITEIFKEYTEYIEKSFNIENHDFTSAVNNYSKIFNDVYYPYMKDKEYIFENYIVHYIFHNMFPYDEENNIFEVYCNLVINYALIRIYLIGLSGHFGTLNEEIICNLVYSYTREVVKMSLFKDKLYELLKKYNYYTLPYMCVLIKL